MQVPFDVTVSCATCGGDGVEPGTQPFPCVRCGGTGRLQHVTRSVLGQFVRTQACPDCARPWRDRRAPVPRPAAARVATAERREREVDIPAGIHDGQRIRLSGEGHAGDPGGRAGDVYVLVRVSPDAVSSAKATTSTRSST